jgi:2-C-methyl-D-erythritol 4-phosphate cytidylyltransferase
VSEPRAVAILCAGGSGERLGRPGGKQLTPVAGRPVLAWTVSAFDASPEVGLIVLVCPEERTEEYRVAAFGSCPPATPVVFAPSGASRQASVASGLEFVPPEAEIVVVHDGARPLVTAAMVSATIAAIDADPSAAGAVVGQPAIDTLKIAAGDRIESTPDRSCYWAVQTPQTFRAAALRDAFALAAADGYVGTDDAAVVEHSGATVLLVEGPRDNIKVTVAEDVALVEATLSFRATEGM